KSVSDRTHQLPINTDTSVIKKMVNALSNDLNTSKVLVHIDNYFDQVINSNEAPHTEVIEAVNKLIGINLKSEDIDSKTKKLIFARESARKDKNWADSDKIRDELKEQGIGINDSANGQIWFRI
ncbi:MAG: hypothetical protein Q7T41_02600, partial [Candidatus Saccharibacteria bacterium]|nr:hypothetical protein [Candidatus Saccharibacteria bacterium]